jgi:hypothetical protein
MAVIRKNSLKVWINPENYLRVWVFFKIRVRKSYKKMDCRIEFNDKETTPKQISFYCINITCREKKRMVYRALDECKQY